MRINWFKINESKTLINNSLASLIVWGNREGYDGIIYFFKIGLICSDCKQEYLYCECESSGNYYDKEDFNSVRKDAFDLTRKILSRYQIHKVKNKVYKYLTKYDLSSIDKVNIDYINELERNLLK